MAPPRRQSLAPTLPHRPREANDLDRSGARFPERRRAGRGRGPRRVDVVDEHDTPSCLTACAEEAADVRPPLYSGEAGLATPTPAPLEQRRDGDAPDGTELPRNAGGGHVTAVPAPVAVTGDKGDDVRLRTRDGAFDDRRKRPCEVAATALLPCRDERPGSCVVDDRGPRRRKAQPAAGALHAAPHRPRAGTAAPLAEGRRDADERGGARGAQRLPRDAA